MARIELSGRRTGRTSSMIAGLQDGCVVLAGSEQRARYLRKRIAEERPGLRVDVRGPEAVGTEVTEVVINEVEGE